ncbi:GtrA family protein [Stenotrophomonas bentonitica]
MISRQFLLFLVAGGIAAGVNFGSRIVLSHWLHYVPAIVIAYCLGMVTAFVLNRQFVFEKSSSGVHRQAGWFILVNVAAVLQTIAISLLLARWLLPALSIDFHNDTLAHAVGVAVPVVTSYLGHKHLSFRRR